MPDAAQAIERFVASSTYYPVAEANRLPSSVEIMTYVHHDWTYLHRLVSVRDRRSASTSSLEGSAIQERIPRRLRWLSTDSRGLRVRENERHGPWASSRVLMAHSFYAVRRRRFQTSRKRV